MPECKYYFVKTAEQLEKLVTSLVKFDILAFDVETSGVDPRNDVIAGFSISPKPGCGFYIPIRHSFVAEQIDPEVAWGLVKTLLTTKQIVCHNGKFDHRMVRFDKAAGYEINLTADTMVMAYCTGQFENLAHGDGETARVSAGLKNVVLSCYGHKMIDIFDLFPGVSKRKSNLIDFTKLTLTDQVLQYVCEDVDYCLQLYRDILPKVKDMLIYKLEMELVLHNATIEDVGVKVDTEYMEQVVVKLQKGIEEARKYIMAEVSKRVGTSVEFDPGSPAQCREVLFNQLKLPITMRSEKTKQPSTSKIALEKLAKDFPVVRNILTFRQMAKQVSGFFATLPDYVYPDTGRIHCDYLQCHVGTGRFASADPNLQNLSKPKKWDILDFEGNIGVTFTANLRDAFLADDDHYFLESDYSQIEAMILASLSGDMQLLDVFENNKDLHKKTALLLGFCTSEETCTTEQRFQGKRYTYAFTYGLGPSGLADREGITLERAEEIHRAYFEGYASIKPWSQRIINEYNANGGVVKTVFGRIRHVPDFNSDNRFVKMKGERSAANTVIQGTAADIQKMSLLRLSKRLAKHFGPKARICMHTHDSNVVLAHRSVYVKELAAVIRDAMIFKIPLRIQMKVDHSIGFKLGSMVELDEDSDPNLTLDFDNRKIVSGKVVKADVENATATVVGGEVVDDVGSGNSFIIKVGASFTNEQAMRLKALLESYPGKNIPTLQTSEGDIRLEKFPTSLTVLDAVRFRLVLPCELVVDTSKVSMDMLGVRL